MTPAEHDPLVDAATLVPGLVVDVRYATADNTFGRPVYDAAVFALRRSVANSLAEVARALLPRGHRLIGLDGYRPLEVQRLLWKLCPVPGFVAPPERGSNHNRGTAVDVTLADLAGNPLEMPSAFDEFSPRAHHTFEACSEVARHHRAVLRTAMEAAGFTINSMEWWHYDAANARAWPVEDVPLSSLAGVTP